MDQQKASRLQGFAHDEFGDIQRPRGDISTRSKRRNSLLPANTFDPLVLDPGLADTLLILTTVDENLIGGFSTTYPQQLTMYCHEMTWSSFIEDINNAAKLKFGQKLLLNIAPMLGKLRFHKAAIASHFRERLQRLSNVLKYWKDILKTYGIHIELKKNGVTVDELLRDIDSPRRRWQKQRANSSPPSSMPQETHVKQGLATGTALGRPLFLGNNESIISIVSMQSLPNGPLSVSKTRHNHWELVVSTGFRRRSQLGTYYSRSRCVSTYSLPQSTDPQRPSTVGMLSSHQLPPLSFGRLSDRTSISMISRDQSSTVSSQEHRPLQIPGMADLRPSTGIDHYRHSRRETMASPRASDSDSSRSADKQESISSQSSTMDDRQIAVGQNISRQELALGHIPEQARPHRPPRPPTSVPSTLRTNLSWQARDDIRRHSAAPDVGGEQLSSRFEPGLRRNAGMKRTKQRMSVVQVHSIDTVMASAEAIVSRQVSERGTIKTLPESNSECKSGEHETIDLHGSQSSCIEPGTNSGSNETVLAFDSTYHSTICPPSNTSATTELKSNKNVDGMSPIVAKPNSPPTIRIVSHDGQQKEIVAFRGLSPLRILKRTISSTFTKG